ncbi:hypothetical protein ACFL2Q_17390 [Thermodesulfobacteriota bacterium]
MLLPALPMISTFSMALILNGKPFASMNSALAFMRARRTDEQGPMAQKLHRSIRALSSSVVIS